MSLVLSGFEITLNLQLDPLITSTGYSFSMVIPATAHGSFYPTADDTALLLYACLRIQPINYNHLMWDAFNP